MINESKNQQLAEKERLRDFHEGASRRPNVRMASGEYSEPSSIPSGYPSGVADRIVYKNAASEAIEMDAPVVILAAESSSWGERRGGKDILLSDDGDEFSTGTIVDETLVEVEINPATPQNPINDQSLVDIPYDFTGIPKMLDGRFEHMDVSLSNATTISLRRNDMEELQAMILKPSSTWSRRRQSGLLGKAETTSMTTENIDGEKRMAYELLDALTKGGALPLQQTTLHVIIGSSHTFERTLINTVVQENVNPIEKLEKTLAVMGSIIHNVPIDALVKPEHLGRLL